MYQECIRRGDRPPADPMDWAAGQARVPLRPPHRLQVEAAPHGVWVLTSLGTHMLKWDQHNQTLSTTFVPLIYLVCKQHESTGAAQMVMNALNAVSEKYFGVKLEPGGACADHCDAFRNAYETPWPVVAFSAHAGRTSLASSRRASTPRRLGLTLTR